MIKRVLLTFTALGLFAASGVLAADPPACTNQTLSGAFTYAFGGEYFTPDGLYHYSAAGRVMFDAQGGLNGKDTVSDGAIITRGRQYTGNYIVNADCTGTVVLISAGGKSTLDFVITNGGKSVNFIQIDPNTNIVGTAQQQFPLSAVAQ